MARACFLACLALLAACSGGGGHASADRAGRAPGEHAAGGAASADRALGAARAPGSASPLDILRAGASDRGFARALTVRQFEFPQDHGPHPAYRHEWWYFTGHLRTPGGERFGFELTFFRVALAAPAANEPAAGAAASAAGGEPVGAETTGGSSFGSPGSGAPAPPSRWRTRQVYVAHFAVTDVERKQFHSTQRFERDALGLAGAQATPFRVWLGGWSVAEATTRGPTAAGKAATPGAWILRAADPAYGLTLELRPLSPPVLNGDRGLSVKSDVPGSASYYYSIPRLAARGRLVRGARTMEVSGTAWLDREWGSGSLAPSEEGWDWFALQLDDGSALMLYALRDRGGAPDPHSAGTWIAADGRTRALSSGDVRIDVLGHWRSPRGTVYPSRWRIRVSALALDLQATPLLADQELQTTPRYWEGDVSASGTRDGRAASGQGYVELVGYSDR